MGQRFQLIVKTPEEYWNENNCNNVKGRLLVYHFQWLWGDFAIWKLGNFIKGIKELIKEKEKRRENYPIEYENIVDRALKWVCYKDLHSQNNCCSYFDEEFKPDKSFDWKEFLGELDNNNGVLFIEITKNNKIRYAFYNPSENESEEARQCRLLDFSEYLEDYNEEGEDNYYGWVKKQEEFKESVKQFREVDLLNKFPDVKGLMEVKNEI